jgi:small subunit ribosomal protein S17
MPETVTNTDRGHRKERVGEVLPSKMAKTIVVQVRRRFAHPEFRKVVTSYKKLYVHDDKGEAKPGDKVRIVESRPLSKLKRWRLVEVIERNQETADAAKAAAPAK